LHTAVTHRFLDALSVMLAPVCPHFCEHLWGEVLGHGAGGASVTRASWPAAGEPDAALLASDAYLSAQLHAARNAITKASGVKPSKVAKGAQATLARPTSATIFVAAGWPDWQRATLSMLRAAWDPAAHGDANNGFPADIVNRVKDAVTADAALKPMLKKVMPLASLTVQGMKGRATPSAELDMRMPFDELAVWTENLEYVRKSLALPGAVRVLRADDAALAAPDARAALDPNGKLKDVLPLDPAFHPFVDEPAA